jgi:hypothetical protein
MGVSFGEIDCSTLSGGSQFQRITKLGQDLFIYVHN